jgi:hypothetical protein
VNSGSNTVSVFRNTGSSGTISYAGKVDFTTGASPISVAIGDLDGDGKADIAVANNTGNTLSVFRNTGSGTISFGAKIDFAAGTGPQTVAIGDLNGDGKADLVVTNGTSVISALRNTSTIGTIGYAARVNFTTAGGPSLVAIGDIDGDGKVDLAVACSSSNRISLLRNTSSTTAITFAAKVDLVGISTPNSIALGDLDGDGKGDLAVGNRLGASLSVFRNTSSIGTVSYAARVDFTTGTQPVSVAIGDLDGDGKVDLATANTGSNTISILRNTSSTGTISYATKVDFATATNPRSGVIADLDGDGRSDLIAVNSGSNNVSILRNNPLFPPTITSIAPTSGVVGTTVTITGTNFNTTPANNVVLFGATRAIVTGATETQLTVTVPVGATYSPIVVLNAATALLAYSRSNFTPIFSPAKGAITSCDFVPKVDFSTGTNPQSIAMGDLDGDGKADMAVTNSSSNTVSIFRNTSTSGVISYAVKVDFPTGTTPRSIAIGDLDGDGKVDLAITNFSSATVSVFRNTSVSGIISYSPKIDFNTVTTPISVAIGDLDGDGKADLAVATSNGSITNGAASVFRNTSNVGIISFATKVDFTAGINPRSIAIGDLDGDGKSDLAVTNAVSNTVSVFRNTSSGTVISYAAKVDFPTGASPEFVAIGDLDGDGKADLTVANQQSTASVFTVSALRNTGTIGTISYAAKVDFTSGPQPGSISIADLNGDGKADLAVANGTASPSSSTVSVFSNNGSSGTISFLPKVDFATGTQPFSVAVSDVDGDGRPDLATANSVSNTVSVFRNNPTRPNIASFTPTSASTGTTVTITGTNFTGATAVSFGGTPATSFTVNSATSISSVVGAGASGTVSVTGVGGCVATLAGFTYLTVPLPTITSFTPASAGPCSTTVTITGTNFTGATAVSFGGTPAASFTVNSATSITAVVGAGASGNVSVTTPNGAGTLAGFTYDVSLPTITSFTPISGAVGTTVAITGTGFSTNASNNIVIFGATRATVSAATATQLTVTVPMGATYAPITVLNAASGLLAISVNNFTPTFSPNKGSIAETDFSPKVDFATGISPTSVAIGDLDGDGKADLALANSQAGSVSVLRNTGSSGTVGYATKVDFGVGNDPRTVAIGDIDGDGKADLTTANQSSTTVSVLLNTSSIGTINFAAKTDFVTGSNPIFLAISDLDGDGKADLAVVNAVSNTVSVYRNTSGCGNISFAPKLDFVTGSLPKSIVIGDLDSDGKADLVVANSSTSTISVFRNTGTIGTISFAARVDFTTSPNPLSVVIGDLDGDGKADLAVGVVNNVFGVALGLSIFRNTSSVGTISFAPKVDFGSTVALATPESIAIGDLDGDGKTDIAGVVYGLSAYSVSIFRNTSSIGTINFVAPVDFATGPSPLSVAIGDLDGDGKSDLAVANADPTEGNSVSVIRNAPVCSGCRILTSGNDNIQTANSPTIASEESIISVSPNPVEHVLQLNGIAEEIKSNQIFDITGRVASTLQFEKENGVHVAPVGHLTQGIYILKVQLDNKVAQVKFIKR